MPKSNWDLGTHILNNWSSAKNMGKWGNLVGKTGEEAKAQILKHSPDVNVQIIQKPPMSTMEYNLNRVRVFVNAQNRVVKQPHIA